MGNLLTFVSPGLGQVLRGEFRKAATMFGSAVITGLVTSGLGWLACGLWSVIDLGKTSASPAAAVPNSAPAAASAAPAATGGRAGSSMAWAFKFTLLAVCAVVVFQAIGSGNVLESMEFFGVRMQFASSLATQAERS